MRIRFCAVLLLLNFLPLLAQESDEEKEEKKKNSWKGEGSFSLMFSQAAYNADWQSGGSSNYAGDIAIDYDLNYKTDRLIWANNFIGEYGLTRQKGDHFMRKTNDKIEVNSTFGYKFEVDSHWSYSFFADFRSQFAKGYEYTDDKQTRTEYTRIFSPGYLKFGPGVLYKNEEFFVVNFAPATMRFVFVNDIFTTTPDYEDGSYFGMDQGKSTRYEFGASLDMTSKITLVENVGLRQKLNLFTDYLDRPKNFNIDYTLKLDMKINKYLSANFLFQAIYEDKAVSGFQVREGIGVGFSYKL